MQHLNNTSVLLYIMNLEEFKDFLLEEKAQSEWSSVYLLIVLIIAALVLISVVKPMFQQSQKLVKTTEEGVESPIT